jgi:RNA polymerase sigma-70 factor (ECF subfamily)
MRTITRLSIQSPPMDDSQLAAQARTDADAFAELYRRHVTRVYRYHMAHTGNIRDAEDLTSQTFMAALEAIRSYRGSGSFAAWIMGIASHKRFLFFRSHKSAEMPLDAAVDLPDAGLPTDKAAAHHMLVGQLRLALHSLSPDRLQAIALCFFAGLEYSEAGRVLGKSEAAVKMLLSRALQDLRTRTSLSLEVQDE